MWKLSRKWEIVGLGIFLVLSFVNPRESDSKKVIHISESLSPGYHALQYDFYRIVCPRAEKIVRSAVQNLVNDRPDMAPALLRLHFHDCFIQGCDASILLDSNSIDGEKTEKDAVPNQTLRGFDVIESIKSEMEKACPGIVSCSDILALATRDAILLVGGPYYPVFTGRRDSTTAFYTRANNELPSPNDNITKTLDSFHQRGFNNGEIVSLLGGHSFGRVHCRFVTDRLYSYNGKDQESDPSMDPSLFSFMKSMCPKGITWPDFESEPFFSMGYDIPSQNGFDGHYYRGLLQGRGILHSDQQLMAQHQTAWFVRFYASEDDGAAFRRDFARAMFKLSSLPGGSNEKIRRICSNRSGDESQ